MAASEKVELRKGLKDVYFDRTTASLIVSKPGKLLYRGYNIDDLARYSTFEETAYLLLHGSLPTASQLDKFDGELRTHRDLPDEVMATLRIYRNAHPMDALRGGLSAMGLSDPTAGDMSPEAVLKKGVRLTASIATLVAAHHRIRNGGEPLAPNMDIPSHAPIPTGASLKIIDGQKLVLETGDLLKLTSDTATSADVVLSILEDV